MAPRKQQSAAASGGSHKKKAARRGSVDAGKRRPSGAAAGGQPAGKRAAVDPALKVALRSADDDQLEVVGSLRQATAQPPLSPEDTHRLVHQIVDEAAAKSGDSPTHVNVFGNLGSFVVAGSKRFVKALLKDTNIQSAMANRQPATRKKHN